VAAHEAHCTQTGGVPLRPPQGPRGKNHTALLLDDSPMLFEQGRGLLHSMSQAVDRGRRETLTAYHHRLHAPEWASMLRGDLVTSTHSVDQKPPPCEISILQVRTDLETKEPTNGTRRLFGVWDKHEK